MRSPRIFASGGRSPALPASLHRVCAPTLPSLLKYTQFVKVFLLLLGLKTSCSSYIRAFLAYCQFCTLRNFMVSLLCNSWSWEELAVLKTKVYIIRTKRFLNTFSSARGEALIALVFLLRDMTWMLSGCQVCQDNQAFFLEQVVAEAKLSYGVMSSWILSIHYIREYRVNCTPFLCSPVSPKCW